MRISFHGLQISCLLLVLLVLTGCSRPDAESTELASVRELIQTGEYSAARGALQALAADDPDNPALFANLGVTHWRLGEIELAVPAFNRAAALDPLDQRPIQIMARLFLERRNPDGALAVLEDVSTPDVRTLTFKAMAHYRAGRSDRALIELNQALEIKPDYPPALYNLASLHRDTRLDPETALRYYGAFRKVARTHPLAQRDNSAFLAVNPRLAELQQQDPQDPETPDVEPREESLPAARAAATAGDYETAVIYYEKAVSERPDLPDALWEMAAIFDDHLEFTARAEALRDRFKRLFPNDLRAAGIAATDESPAQRAQAAFDDGMQHLNARRWNAAAVAFRRCLDLDPDSAGAAYNLGLAEQRRGNPAAAVAAWEQAASRDPNMAEAVYMIALTERERGNVARAIARLNHLLRRHPDYDAAHMLLGLIYRDNARPREAAVHFEQVIALAPTSESAAFARAWLNRHGPDRTTASP